MTPLGSTPKPFPAQLHNAVRSSLIGYAVAGIVLGVLMLAWPGATLLVVAILFGIALIVGGAHRIALAVSAQLLSTGMRWLLGITGAIVLFTGLVCLIFPTESLVLIAIMIGVGWIFQGVQDIVSYSTGAEHAPRALIIASGVLSVVAGIVVLALPGLAVGTFVIIGGILLIAVSIATLMTLPRKQ